MNLNICLKIGSYNIGSPMPSIFFITFQYIPHWYTMIFHSYSYYGYYDLDITMQLLIHEGNGITYRSGH
jgi:hypothetical protein